MADNCNLRQAIYYKTIDISREGKGHFPVEESANLGGAVLSKKPSGIYLEVRCILAFH